MAIFPSTSKRISGVGWWMLYLIVRLAGNHSNKNVIHTYPSFFSVLETCNMLLEEILENVKHFKVLVIWLLDLVAARKIVFTCNLLTSWSCFSRELIHHPSSRAGMSTECEASDQCGQCWSGEEKKMQVLWVVFFFFKTYPHIQT